MNLTEPHCGTDLGLIYAPRRCPAGGRQLQDHRHRKSSSRAASRTSPRTSSTSCSPASRAPRTARKGISLFIVPKFLVNEDGSLGARNGVVCGAIEHKMGIHGNATCVMNYDGATGWLDRRGEQAALQRYVHDDERGAPRRRHPGPRRSRGRLPERGRLCARAPAGPRADRPQGAATSRPIRSSSIPTCAAR